MKNIEKKQLEQLYLIDKKTPHEIGALLKCDHKTIRKYLRLHSIPMRTASEYNYLARKTHISPTDLELESKISLMGHTAYLCEGWHTENTTSLCFCNTDPLLIDLFLQCMYETYRVEKHYSQIIAKAYEEASILLKRYPNSKVYLESTRVTPIIRVKVGGKVLANEFVSNAYKLLPSKIKSSASANFATPPQIYLKKASGDMPAFTS